MEVDLDKMELGVLDGRLLIFRVGTVEHPPSKKYIKSTEILVRKALKGIKNIRIIVASYDLEVDALPLLEVKYSQKYQGLRNAITDLEV